MFGGLAFGSASFGSLTSLLSSSLSDINGQSRILATLNTDITGQSAVMVSASIQMKGRAQIFRASVPIRKITSLTGQARVRT